MFPNAPGPLAPLDPASVPRLQVRRSFIGIIAETLQPMYGLKALIATRQVDVTANPPDDLDGLHATTIGQATLIVTGDIVQAPGSPVPYLLEVGESSNAIRDSVSQYLPPPETPIDAPFVDPPPPPPPKAPRPSPFIPEQ